MISAECPYCGNMVEADDMEDLQKHFDKCGSKSKSKFGNVRSEYNGMTFDSKLERNFCIYLDYLKKADEVEYYLRQTRFDLPGKTTYRVDFTVFYEDGHVEYVDVKGRVTDMFKMKKKQVEDLYPVKIKVVKKGDFSI